MSEQVDLHVLDSARGSKLWRHVLRRQGLAAGYRLGSVQLAAQRSLGFHSARVSSPFTTAAARTQPGTDLSGLLGPQETGSLMTVRCMRRTLHCLPVSLASVAHGATKRYRIQALHSVASRNGLVWDEVTRVALKVASKIAEHDSVGERQLEALLTEERLDMVRLGLRYLWESGFLSYRNVASDWHRQQREFRLSARSHPEFSSELSERTARSLLFRHYFETFGPATLADAAWWSGLPKSAILEHLTEARMVRLRIPWCGSDFYLPSSVYEEGLASPDERIGVSLLAHEDVALKAYFESRQRYLGKLTQPDIFNQIGEVLPVLLCEGIAVGTWEWNRMYNRIRLKILDSAALIGHEDEVRGAVAMMETALRTGQGHG